MPTFKIEQLALRLNPKRAEEALKFLAACGISNWTDDRVVASGTVHARSCENTANLRFNYDAFAGNELELLQYTRGENWLDREGSESIVSHIGMHCEEADLAAWRRVMVQFQITLAQEVWTDSHTNPRIARCRRYHYVIYATRDLIGVDLKFIVRSIIDPAEEQRQLDREHAAAETRKGIAAEYAAAEFSTTVGKEAQ